VALDRGRVPARTVVVTFDDGYADLATEVAPRLEKAGVPATVFLVSRAVDRNREFWWDGLERALLCTGTPARPLRLTIGGSVREWRTTGTVDAALHRSLWSALRARPPEERDALVEEVLDWAGLPPEPRETHRTLRSAELARLAADGLVEIGAHTRNHPWLPGLDRGRQRGEINGGRAELEELVGRPVETFAYPHGGPDDVGPTAVEAVRRAGFTSAFMATPGRLAARGDVHTLPRLFVEDMDGEGLGRLLWRYAGIRVG
jgi:peptidoglycan/xylan/chitin deacetylase (PgdA/CDA1 family)